MRIRKRKLFIIYVIILITIIVVFFIRYEKQQRMEAIQMYMEYPELSTEQHLFSIVIHKKCERGQAYVTFGDNSKYWLAHSRNYQYSPFWLCEFIELGDSLVKYPSSDTLFILRENGQFYFILGDHINEKTKGKIR